MSTLYIVATPIGNLEDLTLRAVRVLGEVPVVVAEDTRVTRKILDHIDSSSKIVSFHRRSTKSDVHRIVRHLDNGDIALVSDAGTPGVNDPGQAIVAAAVALGHDVVPLPGASSIMAALSVSGLYVDQFISHGFLPATGGKRRRLLNAVAQEPAASVFFETPHRLRDALVDMAAVMPVRGLVICRELTKLHEEIWRGMAAEALDHFDSPRGEFAIVVAPLERGEAAASSISEDDASEVINSAAAALRNRYESRRDLVEAVAKKTGLPRRQVYQTLHREG
ncbi:MAG: 16S rRNA (cytidine(1402)-2'-O)-methyltransferase [Chloroflexi bacterium]|nr:16S rRNA (cytidine(1402)-2'-O)-methyltransferase [Chloroflexota bacterium]